MVSTRYRIAAIVLAASLTAASVSGCAAGGGNQKAQQNGGGGQKQQSTGQKQQSAGTQKKQETSDNKHHGGSTEDTPQQTGMIEQKIAGSNEPLMLENGQAIVELEKIDGNLYADAAKMAGLIGFQAVMEKDKNNTELWIGDHDPVLKLRDQSAIVVQEGREIQLNSPVIKRGNRMLVPADALKQLFNKEAVFTMDNERVAIFPQPLPADPQADQGFADDPADPAKKPGAEQESGLPAMSEVEPTAQNSGVQEDEAVPALKNSIAIVNEARKHLGVPYKFGAGPYARTKRFDCSSYVQYVYKKAGITLPRTAREQAKLGKRVSRSQLRVGDLLYFYVPGRFKSNRTVGHVGIYMGAQKMIHSSPMPKDGVQVTDINKKYWKDTYLYSKRLP
ncbi:C40 family peptidase [Paenibacillus tarimensis]|uniref:C40 family peptidase n=1 Tax=Paenibacillus tarimensis TaxID=416012 RepID=UPI001F258978|nr:C40 family peptidase [Paenibacillus tarimensis]MCF2943864.1 NlpC/P60 family protein [Paenibacillus tarimensis]